MSHISTYHLNELMNIERHLFDRSIREVTSQYENNGVKEQCNVTAMYDKEGIKCDWVAYPNLDKYTFDQNMGIGYIVLPNGAVAMKAEMWKREDKVQLFNTKVINTYMALHNIRAMAEITGGMIDANYSIQGNGDVKLNVRVL